MKKLIYVFLILMLSVNYLYAQGVYSKNKKSFEKSETYLISETTKEIDNFLNWEKGKKLEKIKCDERYQECYRYTGKIIIKGYGEYPLYINKYVTKAKNLQELQSNYSRSVENYFFELDNYFEGNNFPASSKVLFIGNDYGKAYAYKNNMAAISLFNRKGIEDTAIFRKRSDGLIEYILIELKDGEKVTEGYAISETLKAIDEYLSIDNKFERNSDCDSSIFKECYYCMSDGGTVYYTKYVYNSKIFQEVYADKAGIIHGKETIRQLPEKTTLNIIDGIPVMFLYKDNILAVSYIIDGEVDSANTIILRKRSDGLIEAVTSEVVG